MTMEEVIVYVDKRFEILGDQIDKTEVSLKERLHAMNDVREQLREQAATAITRAEYDVKVAGLERQIATLERLIFIGVGLAIALQLFLGFL